MTRYSVSFNGRTYVDVEEDDARRVADSFGLRLDDPETFRAIGWTTLDPKRGTRRVWFRRETAEVAT